VRTCRRELTICRNPNSYHRTDNIPSSDRASRCLICNQIDTYSRIWCFSG